MIDPDTLPPKVRAFVEAHGLSVSVYPYAEGPDEVVRHRREYFGEYMLFATVIVETGERVVLIRQHFGEHLDGAVWKIPGGAVGRDEDIAAAAVREVKEETGLDVELIEPVGVFQTGRRGSTVGTIDAFVAVFAARAAGGRLAPGDLSEIAEVRLVTFGELEELMAAGQFSSSQNPHYRAGETACIRRWARQRGRTAGAAATDDGGHRDVTPA